MPELIQDWLGTRMGIVLDMSPISFARNTQDGVLLAKLLHSYGVLPQHILLNIKESKNYYECYNNLLKLKPWLEYIGVIYGDEMLQKMAGGEGSAAISLFYAVYLNLEKEDRFHYITFQKERNFSEETCTKFRVDWVPETMAKVSKGGSRTKLATPLVEKRDIIEWHKDNCKKIVENIKNTKIKFRNLLKKTPKLGPPLSKHVTSKPLDKQKLEAKETRENIMAFEKKHVRATPELNYSQLVELQLKHSREAQSCMAPSMSEAKNMLLKIKRRRKGDIYARSFQRKMQHILLDEQWKEILDRQDKDFEDIICSNLVKQSQYEKQMATKLQLIRHQKKVLAENRKKVECLKLEEEQKAYDEGLAVQDEVRGEFVEDEEFEKERITELHRRLYDQKVRRRRALIKEESQKIYDSLVDMAMRISNIRLLTGCQLPRSFMNDLKELFCKDLPIFDLLDHLEEIYDTENRIVFPVMNTYFTEAAAEEDEGEGRILMYENEEYEFLRNEEMERQAVLDNCDLNDYIKLLGPWMIELYFPDGSEKEVEHNVLGYIIHKLLSVKYPSPSMPSLIKIKPMKPTSIIQGLSDETAINMLTDLMESCKILVVRVENAINFVLAAYKSELHLAGDIDAAFQKTTYDVFRSKSSKVREKEIKRKMQFLKSEGSEKQSIAECEDFNSLSKQTQTPRVIPEDEDEDVLSTKAHIGKLAFEALGAGDPVPDPVIISAIISYLASKQSEYDGWVLLNYPVLYSQASDLEFYLTGFRTLPFLKNVESLEDAEGFSYRGSWGNDVTKETNAKLHTSLLVPKPDIFSVQVPKVPKTYFDSFIKLKKPSSTGTIQQFSDSDENNPIEKFYSKQNVFYLFEYSALNFQTIKDIGKIILRANMPDDDSSDLREKNSCEIFGSIVLDLNEKWETKKKNDKFTSGEPRNSLRDSKFLNKLNEGSRDEKKDKKEEEEGESEEGNEKENSFTADQSLPAKPGEPGWEWVTGSQPEEFQVALASLWENMETVYVEDLKKVFFCLRVHRSNLINYCVFVHKSVLAWLKRSDEKQKVLSNFQQMFNDIKNDLRPDVDVKCELYVRVSELEEALMSLADERKSDSVKDMKSLAQGCWTPDEMAALVNAFLTALQLEADRCIDSCQLIMDYYTSIQQKIPDEKPIPKVVVAKLEKSDQKYSITLSSSSKSLKPDETPGNSEHKRRMNTSSECQKLRSFADKRRQSTDCGYLPGAAEFIVKIMEALTLPEDSVTPFHTFFMDSIESVKTEIKNIVEICLSEARKSDKLSIDTNKPIKNFKRASESKITLNGNLANEWCTALENELSRFLFRAQLILARGVFELNEFLLTILNVLSSITEDIKEIYLKEIESVLECCKVFRCAIEEEIPIYPVLELKAEKFFVNFNDGFSLVSEDVVSLNADTDQRKFRFTIEQLSLLCEKFQRVAPDGEIIKRSLVFILEDLRMLKPEIENYSLFPEIWNEMTAEDVSVIINEVYQELEIVNWKDFILYAMDLSMPTEMEVVSMRRYFRKFDPSNTELINREQYEDIEMWFEGSLDHYKEAERNERAKELLFRLYQVDENHTNYSALLLAFCKDRNPVIGFAKAIALALGKRVNLQSSQVFREPSATGEDFSSESGSAGESVKETTKEVKCCPKHLPEGSLKCIPKDKIVKCKCSYNQEKNNQKKKEEEEEAMYTEADGEHGEDYFYETDLARRTLVTHVPYNILASILKSSFPSLPQLTILLDCEHTFQETLNSIYDGSEMSEGMEVNKLLQHKFISRLLHNTNKFKHIKFKTLLQFIARIRDSSRVLSCADKLDLQTSICLRK